MFQTAVGEPVLHVAVGVIVNAQGHVLLALRPAHVHQGGRWEFPGGKVERGEEVHAALARELHEELGITVEQARPLIRLRHAYPERTVLLDVWRVERYAGEPHGREGQPLEWVAPEDLSARHFPVANLPIITAVRLPSVYAITPEVRDHAALLRRLDELLAAGVRMVQLRAKSLDRDAYHRLAVEVRARCNDHRAQLLLNAPPEWARELGVGVHLTSARLMALAHRPLEPGQWVAASCHNLEELSHACQLGVDFVVAGPVMPTPSHPGARVLGWEGLHTLTEVATVPVYALGGMQVEDVARAYAHGAQGVAVISALWGKAADLAC